MVNHLIWPSNHRHDRGWPSGVFHSCWTIVSPNLYVMKVFLFPITMVNHRGISLFPKGPFQAVDLLYFLIDRVWSISKGPHNKHHSQISQIELHYFPYRANLSSGMVRMWPASLCDPLFFSSWLYFQGILQKFATCALQAYEQIYFFSGLRLQHFAITVMNICGLLGVLRENAGLLKACLILLDLMWASCTLIGGEDLPYHILSACLYSWCTNPVPDR